MAEDPETRYVGVGDADVAFQVIGHGEFDLLYCYGLGSHVELFWEFPETRDWLERLASFSRLIFFDRRGSGASDGAAKAMTTWEEWADDMVAVLDAAGSERTAVLASLDAGPMAILFAAMHPEKVRALILLNTSARYLQGDEYPIGATTEEVDWFVDVVRAGWGNPDFVQLINPSLSDPHSIRHLAKVIRSSATPRAAASQYAHVMTMDFRQALDQVQAPTLVLHVSDSPLIPPDHGRYLAEHIAGARFVELPGGDLGIGPWTSSVADEVAEFLTGVRPSPEIDRILTTILFTDIAGSTERAAAMGDAAWRALLDDHDRVVREQLRRFRGKEINTTGDGFIVSFDGPARAIRCAEAMLAATRDLGIDLRVGVHTGECEVRGDDLGGLAVHIAARIAGVAAPGHILVSSIVRDLLTGSGIGLVDRGDHELKGVPDPLRLWDAVP